MKVLTKEIKKELDLHEISCMLEPRGKRPLPVVFLNGDSHGVEPSDIVKVKTNLNFSAKESEFGFMMVRDTFEYFENYDADEAMPEMRSAENDFLSQYINRLRIIATLPSEILERIEDKRLLAMGYATPKVKEEILKYTKAKSQAAFKLFESSLEASVLAASGLTIEQECSIENLFDEATITRVTKEANDISIELDDDVTFVLTDAAVLEEEINPENAYIDLFELHKVNNNYELHLLLTTKDDNFVESSHYVTYAFKDMSLKLSVE